MLPHSLPLLVTAVRLLPHLRHSWSYKWHGSGIIDRFHLLEVREYGMDLGRRRRRWGQNADITLVLADVTLEREHQQFHIH